jgi:hypothetical protein
VGTTFHRPLAWSTQQTNRRDCMSQTVVTPDTDWFSDPRHYCKVSVTNRCISVFPVMWHP